MIRFLTLCSATALLFLPACGGDKPADTPSPNPSAQGDQQEPSKPTSRSGRRRPPKLDYTQIDKEFKNYPTAPAAPVAATADMVALGKTLFLEESLSKEGNMSCATCHELDNYGQDGKPTSPGSDGSMGKRNTPTVFNAFRQFAQFWDGREESIEDQAIGPMLNPNEHGIADEAELLAKINAKPELVDGFKKAFADGVTITNFKNAVGAFQRTLSTTSKWDKFLDGDRSALDIEEKRGLEAFINVGCVTCHNSRLVGGSMMQELGVYGEYTFKDRGKFEETGKKEDDRRFKVPMLLNVEKTGPWHHDGSGESLEEVVKTMAKIQLDKEISDEEVASIVTFLKALTGEPPASIK